MRFVHRGHRFDGYCKHTFIDKEVIMGKISLSQLSDRGYKVKYLDEPVRCECGFYGLAGQLIVNEDELDDEDTELRCPMCDKKAWQFD